MIKFRTGRSNESGTGSCDVCDVVVVVVTVGAGVCDVNDVNGVAIDGMTIPWLAQTGSLKDGSLSNKSKGFLLGLIQFFSVEIHLASPHETLAAL